MSAAILPAPPANDEPRRKRFTRSEVDRMQELGFFEGQRYELIEGELIDKMGQNPPHAQAIRRVFARLLTLFSRELIQVQAPMECADVDRDRSLPEPDVAILAQDKEEFGTRHPRGDETVLVVEVADASLRQDLTVKRSLYARASVSEYWVLDLPSRRLIIHRRPANGEYTEVFSLIETASVACGTRPDQPITVREILP
jgi:Uma2 family endonuclease